MSDFESSVILAIVGLISTLIAAIFVFRLNKKHEAEKEAKKQHKARQDAFLGPGGIPPKDVNEAVRIVEKEGRRVTIPSIGGVNVVVLLIGVLAAGATVYFVSERVHTGLEPTPVPISISVNPAGIVNVVTEDMSVVPVGIYEIKNEKTIYSLREDYSSPILIVRVDDKANVYELETTIKFKVVFLDDKEYNTIALKNENNGDIILELESIKLPIKITPTHAPIQERSFAIVSCKNDIRVANMRKTPGYLGKEDTDILVRVACGERVELLGETQEVDSLTWWKISWNGYVGWMADHTGSGSPILIFE